MSHNYQRTIAFLSLLDENLLSFRGKLMTALVEKGWDVVAITPPGNSSGERFAQLGVRYIPYKMDRRSTNPVQEILVIWQLARILKQLKPALVQTFTVKPNIYGTLAAKAAQIPFVINAVTGLGSFFVENEADSATGFKNFLMVLYRLCGYMADRVIFQNPDDLHFFVQEGLVGQRKARLIRGSGVDLHSFNPVHMEEGTRRQLRENWGAGENDLVVVLVARLIWDKGIAEFCEAASRLRNSYQDRVIFLLVGDFYYGNPRSVPKTYVEKHVRQGDIIHTGWRDDIPQILDASDIVVLPSFYREGIPVSLQEALAMGKPVITTDTPGCRETVENGVNGFLVPVRNGQAVAEAIAKLIESPRMREDMGRRSREKAEREFNVNQITQQYLKLYAEVLNNQTAVRELSGVNG